MNRRTLIALGVAVFLGLVAVYLANAYLVGAEKAEEQAGTTRVAVAAVPLAYGQELTAEKIKFANFPNSSIPPGSFTDMKTLLPAGQKRVALMQIAVNEPILSGKVTGAGENASIAALLPDGMRAATVRINDVSGVAGFIQPNDSVDVLITRTSQGANPQQITDMLLQNTKVLAMDQKSTNPDGTPKVARTATLQVDPLAAQKLALAQEIGSLSLVLRKPGEQENSPFVETVSLNDLRSGVYGSARPRAQLNRTSAPQQARPAPRRTVTRTAAPRPAAPPKPTTNNVEVVRGTTQNNYEVGEYGQ